MLERVRSLIGAKGKANTRSHVVDDAEGELSPYERELAPYYAGAVKWRDIYGAQADSGRFMRIVTVCALLSTFVLALAVVRSVGQVKAVPYVVQVDKHGYAIPIQPADRMGAVPSNAILAAVVDWVRSERTVLGHAVAQRMLIDRVYALLSPGSAATKQTNEWFRAHNPLLSLGNRYVDVEITRAFPMKSATELTVEWTEHSRTATQTGIARFSAFITVQVSPTRTLDEVVRNPFGIYVSNIVLTQLQ